MPRPDADTDPAASGTRARRPGRVLAVAALGSIAFLFSLAATLPVAVVASYVAPRATIQGYSGTVWNGQARLAGGHAVSWRVDLPGSLAAFGLRGDAGLTGPGTDLTARVAGSGLWRREIRISGLNGRVGWPLVEALAPGLAITCEAMAVVTDVDLVIAPGLRGGVGGLRAGPGGCVRVDRVMAPVPVPAVLGRIDTTKDGLRGILTLADNPDAPLAEALLGNDDLLVITVYPAGAALVPGMPDSGETTLEFPLPAWKM